VPTFENRSLRTNHLPLSYPLNCESSASTLHVLIGKRSDGYYFPGEIDDVQIYNSALTAAQINQLYAGGLSKQSSSTSITSNLNPSTYGNSVTFTATVTPSTPTPTGQVTFYDGGTQIGTPQTLSSGTATLSISNPAVGSHSITASYGGDSNYTGSTSSPALSQTVNPAIVVASSLNPSNYRRFVTFTAVVQVGSGPTPTGTVTFYNGSTSLGTVNLAAGNATLPPTMFPVGSYSITGAYSGDSNYPAGTSPVLTQTVNAPSAGLPPNCSP
jgi:hypothetical protein